MADQKETKDFEENDSEMTFINTETNLEIGEKTVLSSADSEINDNDSTDDEKTEILQQTVTTEENQPIKTNLEYQTPQDSDQQQIKISPGAVLKDRFDLLEVIGQGGMGEVYKALDKRDVEAGNTKFIAIKIINEQYKSDANLLKALHAETRRTQSLAHPNIVTVYDFDRDQNTVFMTMEYIEGIPLNKVIKAEPDGLKVDEVIHLIKQIGNALVYAHSQHIIHLDLKPSNVFVNADKHIKVFDFGISRVSNVFQAKGFDPGVLGGLTPSYASLEMFRGESPDPGDDIYALACMTYELLTGHHPYNRDRADVALKKNTNPERINKLNAKQWKTLAQALALNRKDRIQSVELFLQGMTTQKSKKTLIYSTIILTIILAVILPISYYLYSQYSPSPASVIVNQPATPQITVTKELVDQPVKKIEELATIEIPVAKIAKKDNINTSQAIVHKSPVEGESDDISLKTKQQIFKIGDELVLEFIVKKPVYVAIAVINSKNEFSMLFPNLYQLDNFCKPAVKYQIPPNNAEFNMIVEGPVGKDQIIAVLSEKPIEENLITNFDNLEQIKSHVSKTGLKYAVTSYEITN